MNYNVTLFSENKNILEKFLKLFYGHKMDFSDLSFSKDFGNPIQMVDLISAVIDNNEDYKIGVWISIDKDIFINITEKNLDKIIRYLYERYPTN